MRMYGGDGVVSLSYVVVHDVPVARAAAHYVHVPRQGTYTTRVTVHYLMKIKMMKNIKSMNIVL